MTPRLAGQDPDSAHPSPGDEDPPRNPGLQATITRMFNQVGLQPPAHPNLDLWSTLCVAVADNKPLRAALQPSLVTFAAFDGHIPTQSEMQDGYPPGDARIDEFFAYVLRVIERGNGQLQPGTHADARPACSAAQARVNWYAERLRGVVAHLSWLKDEVQPLVDRLPDIDELRPFKGLEVAALVEQLQATKTQYSAALFRAREDMKYELEGQAGQCLKAS